MISATPHVGQVWRALNKRTRRQLVTVVQVEGRRVRIDPSHHQSTMSPTWIAIEDLHRGYVLTCEQQRLA